VEGKDCSKHHSDVKRGAMDTKRTKPKVLVHMSVRKKQTKIPEKEILVLHSQGGTPSCLRQRRRHHAAHGAEEEKSEVKKGWLEPVLLGGRDGLTFFGVTWVAFIGVPLRLLKKKG